MSDLESLREMFGSLLMQVGLSAFLLIACAGAIGKLVRVVDGPLGELWRRSRGAFAALAILALCMTLNADKTNEMMRAIHRFMMRGQPSLSVSETEISNGYRVEGVATNSDPFAALPSNAVEYARWSMRGGFAADFALDLGDFVFPIGTNRISRFGVLSGGAVEPLPRGTSAAICAAREYASLVPGVSRFWSADADDGAKVLRWDRVFANRDSTGEYTAEMRFFQNGDFTTRSNEVETAYRRVNPDDWDDDGIANERDLNPLLCDGDFYGVANALQSNANLNAYYWLDLSVTGLLDCATIRVTCDGLSDLGDHVVIALTNQLCHVPLLAGATYAVESDLPIDYSAVSSEYAEIATNSATSLTVSLPLELLFGQVGVQSGGSLGDALTANYVLQSEPTDVGAALLSVSGGCCLCEVNGSGFTWICSEECECIGNGHALSASATWEGYTRVFDWWGTCSCDRDEPSSYSWDGVGLSIGMPSTLIANDDDDNDDGWVDASPPFASTDDEIVTCTVSFSSSTPTNGTVKLQRLIGLEQGEGGDRKVYADSSALAQIEEGHEYTVSNSSGATWEHLVNPVVTSSHYLDGQVRVLWKPESGPRASASKRFTVVEPTVEPITDDSWSLADLAGDGRLHSYLYNPCAVVVGQTAMFKVDVIPEDYPDSEIVWTADNCEGAVRFVGSNVNTGRVVTVEGKSEGDVFLTLKFGDAETSQAAFFAKVVQPMTVRLRAWIVGDGTVWAMAQNDVRSIVSVANDIYSQVGVNIELVEPVVMTNIPSAWEPTIRGPIDQDQWNVVQLMALTNGTDGLECYFVNSFGDDVDVLGCNCEYGMAITADGTGVTLAHEIGHAFKLKDIYASNESSTNATVTLKMIPEDEMPRNVYMESDWNAGCRGHGVGGGRFYRKGETHVGIINRMLMNGSVESASGGRDITMGQVHGVRCRGQGTSDTDWTVEKVPVGFFTDADRSSAPVHD